MDSFMTDNTRSYYDVNQHDMVIVLADGISEKYSVAYIANGVLRVVGMLTCDDDVTITANDTFMSIGGNVLRCKSETAYDCGLCDSNKVIHAIFDGVDTKFYCDDELSGSFVININTIVKGEV